MEHFEREHSRFLAESATLLELILRKYSLGVEVDRDDDYEPSLEVQSKKKRARIDVDIARQERRMTCGANIAVKNVLSFLQLK